ncbi:adenylate cyclase [Ketobacter sp. MCCC 1A13808]|uniref:adenylate/guanylate cyclase domain-containing protein n=1 Tax=Ketobacter sp. MCCC 1A13808 TaxID=2602738 RepID=UPI000F2AFD9E|nr:adenylate/guanylate cyclase domain-containing protein [Ketobacter sp. MCCC 1A13808]MVF12602.1 adenylate cyclase [Ketobacter sp. MCCC 1A13808]RLP55599.1 MAG: adenylate cyclase [Ketobacter sp.]
MSGNLSLDLTQQQLINKEFPPQYLRLFAYVISAVVLFAAIWVDDLSKSLWWAPIIALVYPTLSHLFTSHWRHSQENRVNSILIVIDTAMCGGAMALFQFNPTLSLFMFFIVSAGTIAIGGVFGWMVCMCTMVLGMIAGLLLFGAPEATSLPPNMITLAVAMLGTTLFSTALGYFSFKQARTLMAFQGELKNRQREAAKLSRKLSKYLPPQVWGSIFSGQTDAKLETQRKKLTVFFSDIKGFAEISEELQPEALTDLLNSYFTEMSRIALKYGGTIDKFVGDAILIFFGDPSSRGHKQDAAACVLMALEMRKKMKLLRQQWLKEGISKPLQVRMGINTGYCTVGNFGAESRMDYTIIGREVNLASRLESVAQPSEILIAESTYNSVRDVIMCRDRGQISVKGFSKTVPIYEVVDHRKELGATQSFLECELDGFTMFVDIDKIRNYEKDNVVEALEEAAKRIRNKLIV